MKVIYDKDILEIGSAGLRCGRWFVKHEKDKNQLEVGWHGGKMYAYLYTLTYFGKVLWFKSEIILEYEEFLKEHYKGWIRLFPQVDPRFIMKKEFFNDILNSKQPHQGPSIVKDIRKMCPEIK